MSVRVVGQCLTGVEKAESSGQLLLYRCDYVSKLQS